VPLSLTTPAFLKSVMLYAPMYFTEIGVKLVVALVLTEITLTSCVIVFIPLKNSKFPEPEWYSIV
jgi:hypothetical protein